MDSEQLNAIIERIREGKQTENDMNFLSQLLSDCSIPSQLGKYNVNIGQGQGIQIGDRIYNQLDIEAIKSIIEVVTKDKQSTGDFCCYEDEGIDEGQGLETFISYAYEDRQLWEELKKQLATLKRQSLIKIYSYRYANTGRELDGGIPQYLNQSRIILLLISPDFLASDFCHDQINKANELRTSKNTIVIPIRLRPADYEIQWFSRIKPLPSNGKPVTKWENRDEAFLDITQGIRKSIDIIM